MRAVPGVGLCLAPLCGPFDRDFSTIQLLLEHLEGDRMHFEGAVDTLERAIAKQIRRTNDEMVATTRKIVAEVLEEERKKVERQEESKKFMKQHELQRQQDQRDQALIQKITMALKK